MQIDKIDVVGHVTVLRASGDLDQAGITALRDELYACLTEGRFNLVVNLRGVRDISYMALGVLVESLRKVRAFNGDLKLVSVSTAVRHVFRMAGVKNLFETYDSEARAIGVFHEAA
jgi:anti-anti-sigma factor